MLNIKRHVFSIFCLFLFVLCFFTVPPSNVEIVVNAANVSIPSREGDEIVLQCLVRNAKPAAEIVWFKGSAELKNGKENLN